VNKIPNENGKHEVHKQSCKILPPLENLIFVGDFLICSDAMIESRKIYPEVNGCYDCCFPCHKK